MLNSIKFEYSTDPLKHLSFISNWNGINLNQAKSMPLNLKEYENRSKNWLNGRRAPNYAKTLFPEMIASVKRHAIRMSNIIIGESSELQSKSQLYKEVLLYTFLHGICSARVALFDQTKKASLLCANSVKKNTLLAKILQEYGTDSEYPDMFPTNLKHASQHFEVL